MKEKIKQKQKQNKKEIIARMNADLADFTSKRKIVKPLSEEEQKRLGRLFVEL